VEEEEMVAEPVPRLAIKSNSRNHLHNRWLSPPLQLFTTQAC
jgi:hypothetical protein